MISNALIERLREYTLDCDSAFKAFLLSGEELNYDWMVQVDKFFTPVDYPHVTEPVDLSNTILLLGFQDVIAEPYLDSMSKLLQVYLPASPTTLEYVEVKTLGLQRNTYGVVVTFKNTSIDIIRDYVAKMFVITDVSSKKLTPNLLQSLEILLK